MSPESDPGTSPVNPGAKRPRWWRDILVGLPSAVVSVPDGMASSVLAGLPPVHGLYASAAGPIAGGLVTSTRRMVIATTGAAALATASAVAEVPVGQRGDAALWLALLAGLFMAAAGFARLGRLVHFVSASVMLGFLTGVSLNIVLSQIPDLLGLSGTGAFPAQTAWHAVTAVDAAVLSQAGRSLAVAGLAAAILLVGERTRWAALTPVVALAVPSVVVLVLDWPVADVASVGAIPSGLPTPWFPGCRRVQH